MILNAHVQPFEYDGSVQWRRSEPRAVGKHDLVDGILHVLTEARQTSVGLDVLANPEGIHATKRMKGIPGEFSSLKSLTGPESQAVQKEFQY